MMFEGNMVKVVIPNDDQLRMEENKKYSAGEDSLRFLLLTLLFFLYTYV